MSAASLRGCIAALLLSAATLAVAQPAAAPPAPMPSAAAADVEAGLGDGTRYLVPGGWQVSASGAVTRLVAPEGDLTLSIVAGGTGTAAEAVQRAFGLTAGTAPEIRVAAPMPAARGWDEQSGFAFVPRVGDPPVLQAIAHRKGAAWTVALLSGATATYERRGAAVSRAVQSLSAPGYLVEDVSAAMARPIDAGFIAAMRSFTETARRTLAIPGIAIALVDRNGIRFADGFGVRAPGGTAPVTADTRFMIASNTKGLVTLMLAKLVDEGKLAWGAPVTEVYPGFRLGDAATTARVRMRHLVCACTGIPRKDLPVFFTATPGMSSSRVFDFLADTKPTSAFGEAFQYSNLMAAAAGFIGGQAAYPGSALGSGFDRAMASRVFAPLGMTRTTFDMAGAQRGNFAAPASEDLAGRVVPTDQAINAISFAFRPSGGAWSTANDMGRYVLNELRTGVLANGDRYVSAPNVVIRREASVPLGEGGSYGMGLLTTRVAGVPVVHHGGDVVGYKSDIFVLPDAGVGAVLLTNADSGRSLIAPFMRRLVELTYGAKPEAEADLAAGAARAKTMAAATAATLTFPADPGAVAALADEYVSAEAGRIKVRRGADGVRFEFAAWGMAMASRRNAAGGVSFVSAAPGLIGLEFEVVRRDDKRALVIRDGQHEYAFLEVR